MPAMPRTHYILLSFGWGERELLDPNNGFSHSNLFIHMHSLLLDSYSKGQ